MLCDLASHVGNTGSSPVGVISQNSKGFERYSKLFFCFWKLISNHIFNQGGGQETEKPPCRAGLKDS